MSQFNYETYAEAIKGLALLPAELQQSQQKAEALFLNQKKQIEATTKSQLDELEKTEKIAFQQFNDVACEYKVLFSVPVSRPRPVPTPLSLKDAVAAQNILALRLKSHFDKAKQAAVEKKQKELQSLQKQTKEQRTTALTVQEIRSMGKKTITGNITLTPSECSTLKDYAVNGILAKAENSRLEDSLQQAQKSAAVWKQRYEKIYDKYQELKKEVQPYLDAVKLAPEKVRAFLDAILTRTRQTRQHDQPVHRKPQDIEL